MRPWPYRSWLRPELALNDLEVADGTGSSEIEFVLSTADVPCVFPLAAARVCLAMLDWNALTELLSACGGRSLLAQPMLEQFVVGDRHRAPPLGCGIGALRSKRARAAGRCWEFDLGAENDGLLFAGGARDGAVAHVEFEGGLGEETAVVSEPWATYDGTASGEDLVDDRGVDVAAIDVERPDRQLLCRDVRDQARCGFFLRPIGRQHRDREDEEGIEIDCEVALVAVNRFDLVLRP